MRQFILVLPLVLLTACPSIGPSTRPYTPSTELEKTLFAQADRKTFPGDVRSDPQKYPADHVFFWSGIVKNTFVDGQDLVILIEHHYWDFLEDYSIQKEIAFLSPRGEGDYACRMSLADIQAQGMSPAHLQAEVIPGNMILTYGSNPQLATDGTTVLLNCAPLPRTVEAGYYGTDIWDYGRDYILKGDPSDLKVLRVPM